MKSITKGSIGFILISIFIILTLSFASYSVSDMLLINDQNQSFKNFFGYYGFLVSNFLLQYFGFGSVLLIGSILISGIKLFINRANRFRFMILNIFLTIISVNAFSIFLSLEYFKNYKYYFEFLPGGYIGLYIYSLLHTRFIDSVICFICIDITIFFLYINIFGKIKRKKLEKKTNNNGVLHIFFKLIYIIGRSILVTLRLPLIFIRVFRTKENSKIEKTAAPERIKKNKEYTPPSTQLIAHHTLKAKNNNEQFFKSQIEKLSQALGDFGVRGEIVTYHQGPVVTTYEFRPLPGIRSSRVISISDDIARVMMVESVRIFLISGKDCLGIEIANPQRSFIGIRELLESELYKNSEKDIPIILGLDTTGKDIITDLTEMPHALVAGTTGSGKSVGINCMVLSILFNLSPGECRLIMIDPKKLEFSLYNNIPHLLMPVVTEAPKAILALKWAVAEMELRYSKMSSFGVRNIKGFNEKASEDEKIPWIAIFIDEMADILLVAGKEFEILVQRLAQMARAAGIHLVMATQRPSVDVITGVIKANFPTRISYRVTSKIDSRTILGEQGGERLLGKGDMLFVPNGTRTIRVHGPFVSDSDIENICNDLRERYKPEYIDLEEFFLGQEKNSDQESGSGGEDNIYKQAVAIVLKDKKTSISYVQRKLRIGYNKAANLIEQMEQDGILSEADNTGKRRIIQ